MGLARFFFIHIQSHLGWVVITFKVHNNLLANLLSPTVILPNGGHLFEAQSLEIHEKVLIASRDILTNKWFYVGIKRGETVGSDFKFVSSGITVPYISDVSQWLENISVADQCVFVKNSSELYWDDASCTLDWYSICEAK